MLRLELAVKKVRVPKLQVPRAVKRTLASACVLLVLVIAAGLVYVYLFGQGGDQSTTSLLANQPPQAQPIVPTKPPANAREGTAITVLNNPVLRGEEASVGVQTLPGSSCTISVEYNHEKVQASGLAAKTADDFGNVAWDWTVSTSAPLGTRSATITCSYNKSSSVVVGNFEVTNTTPAPSSGK